MGKKRNTTGKFLNDRLTKFIRTQAFHRPARLTVSELMIAAGDCGMERPTRARIMSRLTRLEKEFEWLDSKKEPVVINGRMTGHYRKVFYLRPAGLQRPTYSWPLEGIFRQLPLTMQLLLRGTMETSGPGEGEELADYLARVLVEAMGYLDNPKRYSLAAKMGITIEELTDECFNLLEKAVKECL